mgnify:CR=1 FL=1
MSNNRPLIGKGLLAGLLATLWLAFSLTAFAQSDNTQISGFVKDQTGGAIAGAKVSVKSETKSFERTTTTNAEGYFVVTTLPPDFYTVTVEANGFKQYLEKANSNIERLENIVTDLLEISKFETGRIELHKEAFDLVKLIKKVFFQFQHMAQQKQVSMTVHSEENTIFVFADPKRIMQVLENLISAHVIASGRWASLSKSLLAEAGYPNGFESTLWSGYNNTTSQKVIQFLQQQLQAVARNGALSPLPLAPSTPIPDEADAFAIRVATSSIAFAKSSSISSCVKWPACVAAT